jgi:hypothetical protein
MNRDELEKLKKVLAEAENLCIEFAGEMRVEAQRVEWELVMAFERNKVIGCAGVTYKGGRSNTRLGNLAH